MKDWNDFQLVIYWDCKEFFPPFPSDLPLVSWECRNGKENGKYYKGVYKDYYDDPVLHSPLLA